MATVPVQIVNVELTADMVSEAMMEDPQFAHDVWVTLINGLAAGMMLDNAVDVFENRDPKWKEMASAVLLKFSEAI